MTPTNQQYISFKDRLVTAFRENEARMNGESKTVLHQLRQTALQTFDRLGFPTIKHEEWKYSNLSAMLREAFDFSASSTLTVSELDQLRIPNLAGNVLYFVNGHYRPDLSRIVSPESEMQIKPLAEMIQTDSETIGTHFARYADFQDNAFTALNTAFAGDGVFIRVPDGKTVEEPVILRFITDAREKNVAAQPRNLIVVGRNAEVKLAESYRTLGENAALVNTVTEISMARDARVEYYKVQDETPRAYHIGTTHVNQSDNSHFHGTTVTVSGGFVRNDLNITLDGQHCEAFLNGLYLPSGREHVDNHTLVDHAQPNSYSNELYKGILNDRSTGVFNGKIYVRPDAQKTNAFQSCKNVVLSPGASMNTKPQLEIYADDVKCSHGTTTGKLNEEALFYLQSRGIPKEQARNLLMYAFAEEVISKIQIAPIREYLSAAVAAKLGQ
ncbi:MAG: Fe-S cluster assembly protein SufD [Bacteroidetes bacterium]|nr:Fe-S cluster assembly protein SufD [Fibrella sp.]